MPQPPKKDKALLRHCLAALAGVLFCFLCRYLFTTYSDYRAFAIWVVSIGLGVLMWAAAARVRRFPQMAGCAGVLVVLLMTQGSVVFADEMPMKPVYSLSGATLEGDNLSAELGVFDIIGGKQVRTQKDAWFGYVANTFAAAVTPDAAPLPCDEALLGTADYRDSANLLKLNCYTRSLETRQPTHPEDELRFELYIWYEGLENADTVVMLETEWYDVLIMSEGQYEALLAATPGKEGAHG